MSHFVPQVGKTFTHWHCFVPQGAGRPEHAPAEIGVVANVVATVVRTIRRTIGRGTVLVVVHPGRTRRQAEKHSGKPTPRAEPRTREPTHASALTAMQPIPDCGRESQCFSFKKMFSFLVLSFGCCFVFVFLFYRHPREGEFLNSAL